MAPISFTNSKTIRKDMPWTGETDFSVLPLQPCYHCLGDLKYESTNVQMLHLEHSGSLTRVGIPMPLSNVCIHTYILLHPYCMYVHTYITVLETRSRCHMDKCLSIISLGPTVSDLLGHIKGEEHMCHSRCASTNNESINRLGNITVCVK